jgi:hypothetical protein
MLDCVAPYLELEAPFVLGGHNENDRSLTPHTPLPIVLFLQRCHVFF